MMDRTQERSGSVDADDTGECGATPQGHGAETGSGGEERPIEIARAEFVGRGSRPIVEEALESGEIGVGGVTAERGGTKGAFKRREQPRELHTSCRCSCDFSEILHHHHHLCRCEAIASPSPSPIPSSTPADPSPQPPGWLASRLPRTRSLCAKVPPPTSSSVSAPLTPLWSYSDHSSRSRRRPIHLFLFNPILA